MLANSEPLWDRRSPYPTGMGDCLVPTLAPSPLRGWGADIAFKKDPSYASGGPGLLRTPSRVTLPSLGHCLSQLFLGWYPRKQLHERACDLGKVTYRGRDTTPYPTGGVSCPLRPYWRVQSPSGSPPLGVCYYRVRLGTLYCRGCPLPPYMGGGVTVTLPSKGRGYSCSPAPYYVGLGCAVTGRVHRLPVPSPV